ncbi:MAG: hypothetical protein R2713_05780 [Ilumatobacteraceae bacterium]
MAVNAVMAGLEQRHLPVVLALAEVLANPQYGVEHSGNTTGADALVVVSGPSIAELGFHSEAGALREGVHANTAVGRWLRLYLRNVRLHRRRTRQGHVRQQHPRRARRTRADAHIDRLARTRHRSRRDARRRHGRGRPDERRADRRQRVRQLTRRGAAVPANGLVRVSGWELTHVYGLGHHSYRPLLVLSPLLARLFARHGWSKHDVRRGLWERRAAGAHLGGVHR